MKKILLILTMLTAHIGSMWADDVLPTAVVGTYAFQASVLTTGNSTHTFNKDGGGNITISPNNSGSYGSTSGRFTCTIVIKINVPTNPEGSILCQMRTSSNEPTNAQGLHLNSQRRLKTIWENSGRTDGTTLETGEHTIIYTTDDDGAVVYVDGTQKLTDSGLKASGVDYKAIYIPSTYANYITEIYFFASVQNSTNIASINTECNNRIHTSQHKSTTDVSNKLLVIDDDANLSTFTNASSIYIATNKTLTLNQDNATISLSGNGTALQSSNITTTVTGNLPSLTLKSTAGTLNYNGNNLNGTTLDRVVLNSSTDRIETSGNVTIKNLAGCDLPNNGASNYRYALVGSSGTITFDGNCDFTKKSNGDDALSYNLGYGSGANIVIAEGANVKIGIAVNTKDSDNNASITVGNNATLTTKGSDHADCVIYTTDLTNNGNIEVANGRWHYEGISKIHNTLSGSGILNILEGTTLEVSSMPSTMTLTGSGNVSLTSFPGSTAPTLTEWTGTIEFPDDNNKKSDLNNIFNVWGNENSVIKLNNTNGYFSAGAIVNPTLNIKSGKTLTINDGYSGNVDYPTIQKLTGEGTLALTFKPYYDDQGFNLTINTISNFNNGTLNGQYRAIIVKNVILTSAPAVNDRLFKTSGTVTYSKPDSKLYIGDEDKTAAYAWEEKTVSEVKGYYITESAPANITAAIESVSQRTIGTSVGEYAVSFNGQSYTDEDAFKSAVEELTTLALWTGVADPSFTINQPTSGYYKLKSKYSADGTTDYYLSCENVGTGDTNAKQTTTTNEKNIFYIEVGNSNSTIKSYSTGYLFGEYSRANYTASSDNPVKWTFSEGYNKGTYTLTSNASEIYAPTSYSQILYGWSGREDQAKTDRNGSKTDDGHTDWILIPVAKDELPVIKAPGCTDSNLAILGNITLTSDVTSNITASAKFVDLSDATISASIDEIKTAVAGVSANAIIIAPEGTTGITKSNVLVPTGNTSEYTCNNLQLNDNVIAMFGTDNTSFQNTNVTYTRGISANVWGTICLPYATSTDGDVSYYRLVESGTSNLKFEKVTDANTVANEPYLIKKAENAGLSIGAENQEFSIGVAGAQNGDEHNNFKMQGVLVNTSVIDGSIYTEAKTGSGYNTAVTDAKAYYFDAANNTFCKLNGRFNLKAFRAYLTSTSIEEARTNIGIDVFDNDQPTGISFIESEDGKTVDVIFDLNGRRLQDAKKGINIINGKKVIK